MKVAHHLSGILDHYSDARSSLGCSSVPLQERKEYSEVQAGKRALVLLRVAMKKLDGKAHKTFVHCKYFMRSNLNDPLIGFGDFNTGGKTAPREAFFLSEESCEQGWAVFLLVPGTYYLSIPFLFLPSKAQLSRIPTFKETPLWRVEIPAGTRVVYIGSLHLECQEVPPRFTRNRECEISRWFGFNEVMLQNEEDGAKQLAAMHLADLGPPQAILMQPHSGPIILRTPK